MPEHINLDADGKRAPDEDRDNLIAYLQSPKGLEALADAARAARRLLADFAEPDKLEQLLAAENDLRAASARPLPPELAG